MQHMNVKVMEYWRKHIYKMKPNFSKVKLRQLLSALCTGKTPNGCGCHEYGMALKNTLSEW